MMPVPEGLVGQPQKGRQEGDQDKKGRNERGVKQDTQTPAAVSGDGADEPKQSQQEEGLAQEVKIPSYRRHPDGRVQGAVGRGRPALGRGLGWRYSKATRVWMELRAWEG